MAAAGLAGRRLPGGPDRPGHPPQLVAGGIISFRVFAGYAGWGPGQLRSEIDQGAWYVLPAEPADAFNPEPEQLWRAVLRRSGGALALVATYPEDPAQN